MNEKRKNALVAVLRSLKEQGVTFTWMRHGDRRDLSPEQVAALYEDEAQACADWTGQTREVAEKELAFLDGHEQCTGTTKKGKGKRCQNLGTWTPTYSRVSDFRPGDSDRCFWHKEVD